MNLQVQPEAMGNGGWLSVGGQRFRCAMGRGGVVGSAEKREGDGGTPAGLWPLRRLLFRPDRLAPPATGLPIRPIRPLDAWGDAPGDEAYNRPTLWPRATSIERLWRDDRLYDLVVVVGHNDDPVVAGAGSAIFLHVARPDYGPTEGCVALALADLIVAVALAGPDDAVNIAQAAT